MTATTVQQGQGGRPTPLTFYQGTPAHRIYQVVGWAFLVVPMVVLPYVLPGFRVSQLAQAVGWGVAILGMNLVIGYSGLISLGHIAFTGLGAYLTATLINESRWDMWMTLPVVFVACLLFGALIGLPALKIKGLYLALVTLALAYTFPILTKIEGGGIARRTGGDNGRTLSEVLAPPGWAESVLGIGGKTPPEQEAIYKYACFVVLALVCFGIVRNLMKSEPGRAMLAIRDNQIGAAVSGVDLNRHKVTTFAVSAGIAGIGGSMIAVVLNSVGPTSFDANYAILTLMGLVVGGVATQHGCWIGGLVVVFLQDLAPRAVGRFDVDVVYARALFGVALVLIAFFAPGGVVSLAHKLKRKVVTVLPAVPDPSGAKAWVPAGAGRQAGATKAETKVDSLAAVGLALGFVSLLLPFFVAPMITLIPAAGAVGLGVSRENSTSQGMSRGASVLGFFGVTIGIVAVLAKISPH